MSKPTGPYLSEGSRLLSAAVRGGTTVRAVMAATGADDGMVSRWIYGHRRPGRAYAAKLAASFGVPIESWDAEPTSPWSPPRAPDVDPNAVADTALAATGT